MSIIENYQDLKKQLDPQKIKSDTDSEIIVHLLEKFFNGNVLQTLKNVCDMLRGSFALAVISSHQRDSIFVAKRNSPIVIGLNKNFSCVCSDINSLPKIREVYLLKDNQFAQLTKGKANVYDETLKKVKLKNMANLIQESEVSLGRYQHFMLKEIDEEPEKLLKTIESYNTFEKIRKALPLKVARGVKRVVFIGCGTAYHAGLIGQYLFKEIGLDARCEIASEFRYSPLSFDKHTLAIFISQSGETADTIKALDYCKEKGINTLAITNVKNSTITFKADRNIYTQAGIEIGVASTKAYLCQVELVYLLSSYFKGIKEKNKSRQKNLRILQKIFA